MKRCITALILCAAIVLSGCSAIFDRSYSSIQEHQEQAASEVDASVLRAENYVSLVSCIQYFVSMGAPSGTIHIYNYTGDIEADLEQACQEVLLEDPLGSYALMRIDHDYSRILSYYECNFVFSYRRTTAEMAAIVNATGTINIRRQISDSLGTFQPVLTIKTTEYYSDEAMLRGLVREAYYGAPATALGFPNTTITVYPDSGRNRIIEFTFTYPYSQQTLTAQSQQVASAVTQLVGDSSGRDYTTAWLLYSRLNQQSEYSPSGSSSVYAALCQGSADSEGLALAYRLLCDQVDLSCRMVSGTLDGTPHCWNIVQLDGMWWHLDLTQSSGEHTMLFSDDTLPAGYTWSQDDYPACSGDPAQFFSTEEPSAPES